MHLSNQCQTPAFYACIVSITFGQHLLHTMFKHIIIPFFAVATIVAVSTQMANGQTFEDRRQQYIDSALTNFNGDAITIQAYEGVTVDQGELDSIYSALQTRSTSDFTIVKLIRVMMLSNGAYDSQIIPPLNSVPYWINYEDTVRNYWSENHMIMWMSSDWIMHEYTGRPADATLEARLKHYLQLKIDYGFYEFFSSTYSPYCLSGLLNLADFAQDPQIKDMATQASKKLLKEILMLANDQGSFFPAAGRNYVSKYENPFGQNHNSLIYLLTGLGPAPSNASHAGGFLATSSIDFSDITDSWVANLDTIMSVGHTLEEGFVINQSMSSVDKTVFQWSSGAYFHPEVITQTVTLLEDSNLWNQVDFSILQPLSGFPLQQYPSIAEGLSAASKSTVICGEDVAVFKNQSVTLSSIQDFWKGKVGYQEWPVVANVGVTAVFSASGPVTADWKDHDHDHASMHLPYVEQSHNVALVMYRPEPVSPILPFQGTDVALHWPDTAFSEIVEDGLWLIGKQDDNYVAARRSCIGEINGHRACPTNGGQTWVFVVGNDAMYSSFSNFQNLVSQSQYEETWTTDANGDSTYYASIQFDTISIDYTWGPLVHTGIEEATQNESFRMWPNPATETLTIDLSEFEKSVAISVVNNLGQVVYSKNVATVQNQFTLPVSDWSHGIYSVTVRDEKKVATQRLVKQ
ncbi:MAG: T9SS type A sorting domain-containing protein [Flavobacteriales bacterium]|nr:T9SS type A sorting domain-containing protein [Flavobacteriales bacterium]